MLTPEMTALIRDNTLALVATVTPEGEPAVSPKATVVVLDPARLVFSDLRSPGTRRNLALPIRPANWPSSMCSGARRCACAAGGPAMRAARRSSTRSCPASPNGRTCSPRMHGIFDIAVTAAEMVVSPAYDTGADEAELAALWLARYRRLIEG